MPEYPAPVALLSDFRLQDWYVGVMKGVLQQVAPGVPMIDITHEIPPQDVTAGAFVLEQAYPEFPDGTVFLAVVDPGVGTARCPVVIETENRFWVGPDNGLFGFLNRSPSLPPTIHQLTPFWSDQPLRSNTFHGRDLFAPAAARLAAGTPPAAFGPPRKTLQSLTLSEHEKDRIVYVDHFGNAISNICRDQLPPDLSRIEVGLQWIPFVQTYAEVEPGKPLALVGSTGFLEIAVNQGNAAKELNLRTGEPIRLGPSESKPSP